MQQFVTGVQRAIPENELNELLKFEMIPAYLLDQASALPSLPGSSTNIRTTNDFGIHDLVTDDQLRQIANQAQYKNWPKLALTLGFLEYDIEAYKIKNNNDSAAAVSINLSFTKQNMKYFVIDAGITSNMARTRSFIGYQKSTSTLFRTKWIRRTCIVALLTLNINICVYVRISNAFQKRLDVLFI